MSGPTTVAAAPSDKPTAVHSAAVAADPAGYVQVFVDAWLRSCAANSSRAQAWLTQSLEPDVDLPDPDQDPGRGCAAEAGHLTAVRSVADGCGDAPNAEEALIGSPHSGSIP
ncbi:hypothetical protein ABZT03_40240 [Streptomyces sp. NPDC005574]|uniref:hypothetical protein n=1 Tax=Streptomyces sp. NPDC005574 TaxID=3156891 RepID=UPI0033ACBE66